MDLDDTKLEMTNTAGSNLPIFNQPDLRRDLETYLDIVMDYTQQTKEGLRNIASEKPKVIGLRNSSDLSKSFRYLQSRYDQSTYNQNRNVALNEFYSASQPQSFTGAPVNRTCRGSLQNIRIPPTRQLQKHGSEQVFANAKDGMRFQNNKDSFNDGNLPVEDDDNEHDETSDRVQNSKK